MVEKLFFRLLSHERLNCCIGLVRETAIIVSNAKIVMTTNSSMKVKDFFIYNQFIISQLNLTGVVEGVLVTTWKYGLQLVEPES